MSDAVTQKEFYQAVAALRDDMHRWHLSLRDDVRISFDAVEKALGEKLDDHGQTAADLSDRVLVLEQARKTDEADQARKAARMGSLSGLVAAAGLDIVLSYGRFLIGR